MTLVLEGIGVKCVDVYCVFFLFFFSPIMCITDRVKR